MHVLRVTGTISFRTYAAGSIQAAIWAGKSWAARSRKSATAWRGQRRGFALLWPHALELPNV